MDKGQEREEKLSKNEYFNESYFDKYQLFSLSEQINLIYRYSKKMTNPKIIEVGKGNGFVSDFFKKAGYNFLTFDINKNLEPDVLGSVLEFSDLIISQADIVVACEILEHLPFEMFEKSLEQIAKVTNQYLIITLPEFKKFFGLNIQFNLPKIARFSVPIYMKYTGNKNLGSGHFWEIDYDKHTRRKHIESIIKKYFTIVDSGKFHTNLYHNYYVLKKRSVL
ncbi:MAG: hypothetical protein RBR54_04320 [Sulfurimonas sp.]|jgi:hypothetical protein|nr:hypothetical protein [Sulfurimonas sp.]